MFLLLNSALVLQFVFLVLQWSSSTSVGCGRQRQVARERRQPKVVGGYDTYEGEFPWVVSIRKNGNHHCGGVIVGQRWILTAGHCLQNQPESNFVVRVGEHDLMRTEKYSRDYNVQRIFLHQNYSKMSSKNWALINNADIALMKTGDDIHWNEYAWPVCLPGLTTGNWSGQEAIVVGWGRRSETSHHLLSPLLQKASLLIIDSRLCGEWFKLAGRDFVISDRILCAGFQDGHSDACFGDSGGPLFLKQKSNSGVEYYTVAGIVSTGIGCGRPLMPGIYSNASYYLAWINRTILQFN